MQSSFTTSDNRHVPSTSSTVSTHLKEALKHLRAIHIDRNTHQNLSPEDQQTLNRIHLLLNPQDHAAPSGEVPSTRQRSHEEQQNNPLARVKKRVAPTFVNIAPIDVVTNPVFAPEVEDLDQDSDGESVSSVESDITLDIEYTWCLDRRPKPGTASSAYYQYMQAIRVQKAQWWVADNVRKPEKTLDDDDTIVNFDEDDEIELTDDESDDDDEMELDQGLSIDESVAIIEAAIKEYENLWDKKKRPLRQAEALRFWQQFYDAFERYEASQAQKRKLKHFLKRLDSIKAGLLEGENANREILKRLCGALEATVFDIQDARFKESILDGFEAPISTKSPRHRRVKKIMDDLELDGLDIASESEAESNVDFIDIDENEENEENLEISDCQILGNDAMEIPSAPHSNVENLSLIPLIIIDLTLTDPESEFDPEEPKEQEAANVVEAPVQSAAEDGDSENAELLESDNGPPIVLTPHKKRKKEVKESKEGKELRAINARRFQEESERITQNLYQLRTDSSFTDGKSYVINIGKSEDEDFIFINSKASKCIKNHQVEGLQFLWREVIKERDAANASGCMLSHTMGLGKTLQAITLLVTIQEAAKSSNSRISSQIPEDLTESSTLILCPPNIVHNWQQEIMKWIPVPSILGPVYVINAEQPNYDRRDTISRWSVTKGVLIIGFHLFKMFFHPDRGDKETAQLLNSTPNLVIVDEAHNLKNTKASITDAARGLKTKRRIALTGTPISNNLEEYWSMIDFVSPGYLGTSVEFRARFAEPIECGNYKESTIFERRKAHTRLTVLEKHLQPKVHRRDASALKDTLPPLHDNIIKMKLTGEQITAYNEYVDLFKHSTEVMMHSSSFLTSIHDLILLCNHPRILHEGLTNRKKTNEQKVSFKLNV
jgi:SNF2 family DNA or RNA helicase